ncbi:RagB/SusD family nutrient uptake outer membrane protein [Chitinophaga caeni]|uniref:RagB/SusD family nutrient uptake outer membrane protein n=1 Tax=Chitinophaga caeni TaxID=2029983 RepID=A0A291QYD4_9BACT|nr:RagB/SusD family nutrient uptake outer membrane protein [Chitinophaga caeni]ATL48874.1 RagB/SusD family nutrient uptake outer membrane protein [Chitinophaga caeni]
MRKIFIPIYIIIISCGIVSCDKFLDVKPKGYTIPQFYEDYAKLMNNMDLVRVSAAYPNYITDDVRAGDIGDPSKSANWNLLADYKKYLYKFENGAVFLPGVSDPLWEPAYSHIYTYNIIINNIMDVPDATDDEKKALRAEALVGRALEYLLLVNAYANHYDPQTADKDLGVPLVLSEDINAKYKRNTVAEVYALIKNDLEEGLADLPTQPKNIFRPSKSVGYAFLGRMYLYMGNYAEALKNAKSALELNSSLLDYKLYTNKEGVTFGRVCLAADNTVRFPNPELSDESIWVKFGSSRSSSVNAEVYVSDDLLNIFSTDLPSGAIDKRRQLFYCDGYSKFSSRTVLFPGKVLYAPYVDFNLALSTPELYLVAAECEARVGDKDKAINYVNSLRDYRIENNQPLMAANKEQALDIVLRERRREFCFVGCTRLIDLKRLNRESRYAKDITHTTDGENYTLPANDQRYILPVPPKVLEFNPNIPQYER